MKKKLLALLLAALMAATVFAGCTGSDSPADSAAPAEDGGADPGSEPAAASSGDGPRLTLLCGYASEDPHGQYIYQYAESFQAETGIEVEVQAISTNDIYTRLAAMATTPGDVPTMFFTSADQVATLYDLGMTEDLNNHLSQEARDGFANGAYEATLIDGQMTFYPINVQPLAVIYRKDRFAENGLSVPASWDEFVEVAKTLTVDSDEDGEIDQWGFSMVGSNNSSGQSRFMSYLWSNGFSLIANEGGVWTSDISTDPAFVEAFSRWTDMNNVYGVVPTGITEVDYATAANYFAMGYTNIFLTGSNALGVAYASNPDLEGNLASFKLPGDFPGTMLNAEGYALSAFATDEEKAAAVQFLTFFTSHDDEMQFWNVSGKIPSTIEGQKVDYITNEDYAGYLAQIESGCIPTVTFPGINGLKSALGDAYSAVFSGEKSNEEAVESLVRAVEELLADYN